MEQILNAVKGEPCRYLKREHSSSGNKCEDQERGASVVCSRKCKTAAVQVEWDGEGGG